MSDNQVLTRLVARYEEMKGGYATADAKISLQSISPLFIELVAEFLVFYINL